MHDLRVRKGFLGCKKKKTNYKRKKNDKFDLVKTKSSDHQNGKPQIRRKHCI